MVVIQALLMLGTNATPHTPGTRVVTGVEIQAYFTRKLSGLPSEIDAVRIDPELFNNNQP